MSDYLKGIDDNTLRNTIIESIRSVHGRESHAREVDRNMVVNRALIDLAQHPGTFWGPADVSEIQKQLQHWHAQFSRRNTRPYSGNSDTVGEQEDNSRIESVFWDLITRGLLYPRLAVPRVHNQPRIPPHVIEKLCFTPLGERYFGKPSEDLHPSDSEFTAKVVSGISTLPPEVRTALEEAQACFRHRLLRSAVIMLGLAYEAMAAEVFDVVVGTKRPREAKDTLDKIDAAVRTSKNEAAIRAIRTADHIRTIRNEAAHRWTSDFADVALVESLLILGALNLRTFWSLTGK